MRSLPLSLLLLLPPALASSGDRSPLFQSCLSQCTTTICASPHGPPALPLELRLTLWSCADNCAYECMHSISPSPSGEIEQYYGKWPFERFMGAQEPASVVFSVLNGWMHWRGLAEIRRRTAGRSREGLCGWLEGMAFVGMNAWLWSAVFHTRDTPWTERLDYFSAALAIIYSLYYTLVRLFHLYTPTLSSTRHGLLAVLLMTYTAHVSYLTWIPKVIPGLPRFDYGYNMLFNVLIGLTHNALWLFAYAPIFPQPRPKLSWKPAAFVVLTMSAMSLELLDFPPLWKILDAHALWHGVTIPLVPFWYGYLIEDSIDVDEANRTQRPKEKGKEKEKK